MAGRRTQQGFFLEYSISSYKYHHQDRTYLGLLRIGEEVNAQRIRLDCESGASHNLNRLLDKPGLHIIYENIFLRVEFSLAGFKRVFIPDTIKLGFKFNTF